MFTVPVFPRSVLKPLYYEEISLKDGAVHQLSWLQNGNACSMALVTFVGGPMRFVPAPQSAAAAFGFQANDTDFALFNSAEARSLSVILAAGATDGTLKVLYFAAANAPLMG